ncbi:hypothetical protein COBT_000347 [Conglomerata obtusa]
MSSSSSDSNFDYEIGPCNDSDIPQITNIIKPSILYTDILTTSTKLSETCSSARSDDFLLAYAGIVDLPSIIPLFHKNFAKKVKKFNSEHSVYKLFVYGKICNTPYNILIELLNKMVWNAGSVLYVSRCEISKNLDELCVSFTEYKRESLRYFPIYEEEVFFINNNEEEVVIESNDKFYRLMKINKENFTKFLELLKDDVKKN